MNRTYWHSRSITLGYPVDDKREVREQVDMQDANLVASLLADGRHAPAIDLDLPCELIPSSTPGHHHLLIDHPMSWFRYRVLLRVLVWCGLVEPRYYRHSVRRGMTMLRLPWVKKGVDYQSTAVQGQVFPDGSDTLWVSSRQQGDGEGQWFAPPRS